MSPVGVLPDDAGANCFAMPSKRHDCAGCVPEGAAIACPITDKPVRVAFGIGCGSAVPVGCVGCEAAMGAAPDPEGTEEPVGFGAVIEVEVASAALSNAKSDVEVTTSFPATIGAEVAEATELAESAVDGVEARGVLVRASL